MATEIRNNFARKNARLAPGLVLVLIGILSLAGQFIQTEWFGIAFLATLGLIFLVWGVLTRTGGLLVPGGILSGIAGGIYLTQSTLAQASEETAGGLFLLSFAAGWVLVTLLSLFFAERPMWWPLIPAGILGMVGGAVLAGEPGLQLLKVLGAGWPLILIAIGLYLAFGRRGAQEEQ